MMNDLAPVVIENNQTVQQLETNRRNDKEVDRGNAIGMVAQKGPPTLAGPSGVLDHVLGDG
jgi:hypothetical protein